MAQPKTVTVNQGSTDQEILDRAKCVIEIGGRMYEWTEMGRRQGREALAEMLPIMHRYHEEDSPAARLKTLNDTLDFFYKHHARMNSERGHLDNAATNDEIAEALIAIRGVIDAPFRRDVAEALAAAETTPTLNQESSS
ncbi:MAG: hypothetical protein KJ050_10635 [Candidatus Omnitrophica bacterium]|nr:hypothetical protein [Candidatus Omnitrophota bacterium]